MQRLIGLGMLVVVQASCIISSGQSESLSRFASMSQQRCATESMERIAGCADIYAQKLKEEMNGNEWLQMYNQNGTSVEQVAQENILEDNTDMGNVQDDEFRESSERIGFIHPRLSDIKRVSRGCSLSVVNDTSGKPSPNPKKPFSQGSLSAQRVEGSGANETEKKAPDFPVISNPAVSNPVVPDNTQSLAPTVLAATNKESFVFPSNLVPILVESQRSSGNIRSRDEDKQPGRDMGNQ